MTLSTTSNKILYAGDGATLAFAVPFPFLENAQIEAVLRDAAGAETAWAETTDYTLSGAGTATGGTLTATTAPAAGEKLVIRRVVAETQETDYPEGGAFPAAAHEQALDKLTMLVQQHSEEIARSLLLPVSTALSGISVPEPGAGEFLRWNTGGTALETATLASLGGALDTVFGGLAADDFLKYDGTSWINRSVAEVKTDLALSGADIDIIGMTAQVPVGIDQNADYIPGFSILSGDNERYRLRDIRRMFSSLSEKTEDFSFTVNNLATFVGFNKSTAVTGTLPAAGTLEQGWWCAIKNFGAGPLTLSPDGAETIDSKPSLTLIQGDAVILCWRAVDNWQTTGLSNTAGNGLVPLQRVTGTAVSSLDVTTALLAHYDRIVLDVHVAAVSQDDAALFLLASTDGGAGFDNTSEYDWTGTLHSTNAVPGSDRATADAGIALTGTTTAEGIGSGAGEGNFSARVEITHAADAAGLTTLAWQAQWMDAAGQFNGFTGVGRHVTAETHDAFRIVPGGGTITGSVSAYGVRIPT